MIQKLVLFSMVSFSVMGCSTLTTGKFCSELDKDFRRCETTEVIVYQMGNTVQYYVKAAPTKMDATPTPTKTGAPKK